MLGCGQIGHKQSERQGQQQNRSVPVQGAEATVPEQPTSAVSPAGFGMAGIGIGSVWEVGNVEARYEGQTDVQNRFDAFEEESEDGEEVEEEMTESFISPKANVCSKSQAEKKEAKKKAKEEDELMESLISANMVHATATPPTRTSIPPSLAPTSEAVNGQVVKGRPSPAPTATPTTRTSEPAMCLTAVSPKEESVNMVAGNWRREDRACAQRHGQRLRSERGSPWHVSCLPDRGERGVQARTGVHVCQ